MADPNTRQGKRTPVTLKIKFKSETLEQFIERYAVDVSQGGIFIRTKEPLAVGTAMKFEFQLRDASPLIGGEGTVVWTRENDPSRPAIAPGMGVRFDRLSDGSQIVLDKILAEKAKQAPQRGAPAETGRPAFTDTPTRVAPLPVQDAMLGGRARSDSEQTPLPKPMPFHSDADEFGAEAFEEATKVRALDELVAATAADAAASAAHLPAAPSIPAGAKRPSQPPPAASMTPTAEMSPLVAQSLFSTGAKPAAAGDERDSAPPLPSAPEASGASASGRTGKLLDTSPSPRPASPSAPPVNARQSDQIRPLEDPARTKLGVEPAKLPGRPEHRPVTPAVAAGASGPVMSSSNLGSAARGALASDVPPARPSIAPMIIGVLVIVAAVCAAVWYFVLRDKAQELAGRGSSDTGSAIANNANTPTPPPSTNPVGSAQPGSAAVAPPAAPMVDIEITANVDKAIATVADTGATGPVPFKTQLEKDKAYKVTVAAPGFLSAQLDVKGGQDSAAAKLVAKKHVVAVTSDPPGAQIFIDSSGTGHATPFEIELSAAQAARPKVHVGLRKGGFRPLDQIVDAAAFADDDQQREVAHVDAKLVVAPAVVVQPPVNNGQAATTHTGGGSAAGPPDSGSSANPSGTAPTPPSGDSTAPVTSPTQTPTTTPPPAPTPTPAPTPAPSTGSASSGNAPSASAAEPEPTWDKHP